MDSGGWMEGGQVRRTESQSDSVMPPDLASGALL
jgi:hypothetical protein